eukprot:scaffold158571_cov31-Tisochrysis_lutea.AAC.1
MSLRVGPRGRPEGSETMVGPPMLASARRAPGVRALRRFPRITRATVYRASFPRPLIAAALRGARLGW